MTIKIILIAYKWKEEEREIKKRKQVLTSKKKAKEAFRNFLLRTPNKKLENHLPLSAHQWQQLGPFFGHSLLHLAVSGLCAFGENKRGKRRKEKEGHFKYGFQGLHFRLLFNKSKKKLKKP